eukprot:scaffold4164_cov63-Phaeocystis_antarctica.AAC.1
MHGVPSSAHRCTSVLCTQRSPLPAASEVCSRREQSGVTSRYSRACEPEMCRVTKAESSGRSCASASLASRRRRPASSSSRASRASTESSPPSPTSVPHE